VDMKPQSFVKRLFARLRARPLVWDTLVTTLLSALGRFFGLAIPFFIAVWYGVSATTDAFFFAYGFILFCTTAITPIVESVIVPFVAEAREQGRDVGGFVGQVLFASTLLILGLLFLLVFAVRSLLSRITNFEGQTLDLTVRLVFETAPLVLLMVWSGVLAGTLNTYKKFAYPAISPAVRALVNLSAIYAFKTTLGVHAIALGYVLGESVRCCTLLGVVTRLRLCRIRMSLKLDPGFWEFLRIGFYQFLGMLAVGLNPVIDKAMASWLQPGSVSLLHYADRLYMIPVVFLTQGLVVTVLSHWSSGYYQKGYRYLWKQVLKSIAVMLVLVTAILIILLPAHKLIVHFVLGFGNLADAHISAVQQMFFYYLLGLFPTVCGYILARAYLVLKRTRTLLLLAVANVTCHVILNFTLIRVLGLGGIALSTTITALVISIALIIPLAHTKHHDTRTEGSLAHKE